MSSYPTIHVKNFARIRDAVVEIAPLTLFVGDNNSGKTYLSSLIWGIRNFLTNDFFADDFWGEVQEKSEFHDILDWIQKTIKYPNDEKNEEYNISEKEHNIIIDVINQYLSFNKEKCVQKIFGSDVPIQHLAIEIPFETKEKAIFVLRRFNSINNHENEQIAVGTRQKAVKLIPPIYQNKPVFILQTLIQNYYRSFWKNAIYFPASRAGLLLTYRSLLDESLEIRFSSRKLPLKPDYQLTQPQVNYIRQLLWLSNSFKNKLSSPSYRFDKVVNFIETEIIDGQVLLSDTPVPEILYQPKGSNEKIPMQLVSGVVSEIASILVCLKFVHARNISYIIEEPELSLHPELQQRMAQMLIRLSHRYGVLVTTHSTIIAQHINNMIRYNNRQDGMELAREYGYTKNDFIIPDRIRMYQFDVEAQDGLTDVSKLEPLDNGFPIPTFADTLREIRNEAWNNRIEKKEELNNA
ncbi:MAG: ATP-binding protein [Planctomycetaceae bacterium]|nr:ATP-binding protein [Planctomycetaceae bacterium]